MVISSPQSVEGGMQGRVSIVPLNRNCLIMTLGHCQVESVHKSMGALLRFQHDSDDITIAQEILNGRTIL